jgi:hypothetical protein
MELDLDLEYDANTELYYDLLVLYLLVDSALGECELQRRMGAALDSGETERLAAELRHFATLPEELRSRVLDGDPTLNTIIETGRAGRIIEPRRKRRPASA